MMSASPPLPLPPGIGKPLPQAIRLLSMDGGGIYGYITALMLRALCAEDPNFLSPLAYQPEQATLGWIERPGAVWAFAGTSAGSLNALLLANAEDPRAFVTSGQLEAFWLNSGAIFAPPSMQDGPMGMLRYWMSYWSLVGWFGTAEYERFLRDHFGDRTLGQLKHRVLLTSFNWTGEPSGRWRPKVFVNFPARREPDRQMPIWQAAYLATSPPGLRQVRWGFGDGGTASPDPSLSVLVELIRIGRREAAKSLKSTASRASRDRVLADEISPVLKNARLLSVGVCSKIPAYERANFDFGSLMFNALPTNPSRQNYWPPMWQISIDPATESSVATCQALLGARCHRLDPDLLGPPAEPPTLAATMLARNPMWRQHLIERQQIAMQTPEARAAVQAAATFLREWWSPEKPHLPGPPDVRAPQPPEPPFAPSTDDGP
ncbi:MAG: patatin-like phospholipase family protein [Acidobacteriota bacterium]